MAIIARFSFDVPFGKKAAALELLNGWNALEQELGWPEARLIVGSIGVPESRVEADYEFDTIADLEVAWSRLGDPRVPKFVEQIAQYIVPGSHRWDVYRVQS